MMSAVSFYLYQFELKMYCRQVVPKQPLLLRQDQRGPCERTERSTLDADILSPEPLLNAISQ